MTASEHFHETDPTGLQTLERFEKAGNFNQWLFETIVPYCKGHVLETGSGIGNISHFFLEQQFKLTVSDLRNEYLVLLQQKFSHFHNLEGIRSIDLVAPDFDTKYAAQLQHYDTLVALNVIEHIEDAEQAIQNCKKLLRPGGHLVILVPAWQFLYNPFDEELGHYRRYTARSLRRLLQSQQLEVIHQQYFNAAGIPGWFVNGTILRKRLIPSTQLQIFNKLIPAMRLLDTITFHAIGLSVIGIARKPE
ncbi:MAG: class I SAM-dependent methyltransferase [Chitinophagaceae bacterium]